MEYDLDPVTSGQCSRLSTNFRNKALITRLYQFWDDYLLITNRKLSFALQELVFTNRFRKARSISILATLPTCSAVAICCFSRCHRPKQIGYSTCIASFSREKRLFTSLSISPTTFTGRNAECSCTRTSRSRNRSPPTTRGGPLRKMGRPLASSHVDGRHEKKTTASSAITAATAISSIASSATLRYGIFSCGAMNAKSTSATRFPERFKKACSSRIASSSSSRLKPFSGRRYSKNCAPHMRCVSPAN